MRVNVVLDNNAQVIMGELEQASSSELFIRAAYPWTISGEVSFRVSLGTDGEWLKGRLRVRDIYELVENHTPLARCSILSMSKPHRQRLRNWIGASRSTHSLWAETSSLYSTPNIQQRQKFRTVLRQRVRKMRRIRRRGGATS